MLVIGPCRFFGVGTTMGVVVHGRSGPDTLPETSGRVMDDTHAPAVELIDSYLQASTDFWAEMNESLRITRPYEMVLEYRHHMYLRYDQDLIYFMENLGAQVTDLWRRFSKTSSRHALLLALGLLYHSESRKSKSLLELTKEFGDSLASLPIVRNELRKSSMKTTAEIQKLCEEEKLARARIARLKKRALYQLHAAKQQPQKPRKRH